MANFETVPGPPGDEAARIDNIVKLTILQLKNRYVDINAGKPVLKAGKPVLRGVHPKDHGCVTATFTVLDPLPERLQVGVFAKPGHRFNALIRFSNAAVNVNDRDSKPPASPANMISHGSRGMAIKLLEVSGAPLMPTNGPLTQDFLMVNHPVFAFATVADYEALTRIMQRS